MKLSLKQFLNEAQVKDSANRKKVIKDTVITPTQAQQVISLLKKNCSEAFNSYKKDKFLIYRGMSPSGDVLQVQYSKGTRRTENTPDYYRMIIDTNPEFVSTDLPKRSKSMIATTDYYYAKSYGSEIYAVFPFDATIIGVAPSRDIFDIRFKMFGDDSNVDDVSLALSRIFNSAKKDRTKPGVKTGVITPEQFIKNIDIIGVEEAFETLNNRFYPAATKEANKKVMKKYGIVDGKTFLDYFYKHVLCQKNLKFKAMLPSNFYKEKPKNNEVWIGEKCIMIEKNALLSIINLAEQK